MKIPLSEYFLRRKAKEELDVGSLQTSTMVGVKERKSLLKEKPVVGGSKMAIKKAVLLPDIHFPDQIRAVTHGVLKFLRDFKPDYLIYMGDQLTMDMISSWTRDKPRKTELQRLKTEYTEFNKRVLLPYEKAVGPDCEKVWIIGNHEQRAEWYLDKYPALTGLIEPHYVLNLEDRGYDIIEFGDWYELGKLYIMHGPYWNKYHAAKTVDEFENSVCYAHTHNPQQYAKGVPRDTKKYHIATCLGCLCTLDPDYKKGKGGNRWINQFGVVYLDDKGYFWLYPVTINLGRFIFNGKHYY